MPRFGKKKSVFEYLYSKPAIAVLLILVVLLGGAMLKRYTIEREMAARVFDTQQERDALIERKKSLEERVEYLSGERGVEEEIRKHFDVAREGEQVIILTGEYDELPEEEEQPAEKKPWYILW